MSRQSAIDSALTHFDDPAGFFEDLKARVAVKTESQNPERIPDCYEYLEKQMKPKFEAKLTLRDTLKSTYDSSVRMNSNELSLQSLKLQQDARQKLNNVKLTE